MQHIRTYFTYGPGCSLRTSPSDAAAAAAAENVHYATGYEHKSGNSAFAATHRFCDVLPNGAGDRTNHPGCCSVLSPLYCPRCTKRERVSRRMRSASKSDKWTEPAPEGCIQHRNPEVKMLHPPSPKSSRKGGTFYLRRVTSGGGSGGRFRWSPEIEIIISWLVLVLVHPGSMVMWPWRRQLGLSGGFKVENRCYGGMLMPTFKCTS